MAGEYSHRSNPTPVNTGGGSAPLFRYANSQVASQTDQAVDNTSLTTQQKWQAIADFMQGFTPSDAALREFVISPGGGAKLGVGRAQAPTLFSMIISQLASSNR